MVPDRLVPFLDKKTGKVVYTDFQDEITAVREDALGGHPNPAINGHLKTGHLG